MPKNIHFSVLFLILLTAACTGGSNPTQPGVVDGPYPVEEVQTMEKDDQAMGENTYLPGMVEQSGAAYPVVEEPAVAEMVGNVEAYPLPITGIEPRVEEENWARGAVYLNEEESGLVLMESYPVQVFIHLVGETPNACHQLRMLVQPDYAQMRIDVDVYSVVDSSQMCVEALQPFDQMLPLGVFSQGTYAVYLNGELFGTIDA